MQGAGQVQVLYECGVLAKCGGMFEERLECTVPGPTRAGRTCVCILHAAGLVEVVAPNSNHVKILVSSWEPC
jgi:hypothetical protein